MSEAHGSRFRPPAKTHVSWCHATGGGGFGATVRKGPAQATQGRQARGELRQMCNPRWATTSSSSSVHISVWRVLLFLEVVGWDRAASPRFVCHAHPPAYPPFAQNGPSADHHPGRVPPG